MKNGWRLIPKIRFENFNIEQASEQCFRDWFVVKRFWSGKLIYIHVRFYAMILDFRKNWVEDMKGHH